MVKGSPPTRRAPTGNVLPLILLILTFMFILNSSETAFQFVCFKSNYGKKSQVIGQVLASLGNPH